MTTLTLHLNDDLKTRLETFASKRGQSLLESAYDILNRGFEIAENEEDLDGPYTEEEEALFYSPENIAAIKEGIRQLESGECITMTIEELRATLK